MLDGSREEPIVRLRMGVSRSREKIGKGLLIWCALLEDDLIAKLSCTARYIPLKAGREREDRQTAGLEATTTRAEGKGGGGMRGGHFPPIFSPPPEGTRSSLPPTSLPSLPFGLA